MASRGMQITSELIEAGRRTAKSVYQKKPHDKLSKSRKIKSSGKSIKGDTFGAIFTNGFGNRGVSNRRKILLQGQEMVVYSSRKIEKGMLMNGYPDVLRVKHGGYFAMT
jgi:hypothetical protein